jgi:hypothetical protein
MDSLWMTALTLIAPGALSILVPAVGSTGGRYRYKKLLRCPETKRLAEVDVEASRAALSSAPGTRVRVKNCSLWPEKRNCAERCIQR